ncbi:MAG: N-acetylglucosamine-6-phosphate deacetylase [Terriglobales bacterium]
MTRALIAARVITPRECHAPGVLLIEDGRITAVGRRDAIEIPRQAQIRDCGGATLAPGFIDLHVHGGGGRDFMQAARERDRGGLEEIRRHLARHGVTTALATTMTAPWEQTLAAMHELARAGWDIHAEGPFLSRRQPGVHPPELLLEPTRERLDQMWDSSQGRLRWITLAPELPGASEFIAAAVARGIGVALGHSDATLEQARAGIAAGARHATHVFNAMRPLHHREPGLLAEVLGNLNLSAEIIADGIHVDPVVVNLFLRLKGENLAVLVSDGISAAGCGDGEFLLGELQVEVKNGRCLLGDKLAGSVLTLDAAVQNIVRWSGWPIEKAVQLATLNPANALGLKQKGRLEIGADADLVELSPQGGVMATYVAGQQVN